jgi:nitric oxide dioxygenase
VNADAIDRLKVSFEQLSPSLGAVSATFYDRLFEVAPEVRRLFAPDMTRQRGHFEAALALLLRNITLIDVLGPSLMALGAEHVAYGTRPEHYDVARECLIFALGRHAGENWTPEIEGDWRDAITAVMQPMLRGAAMATAGASDRIVDTSN